MKNNWKKNADKLNNYITRAETNIQKANKTIREVTNDIGALFKHLNIKKSSISHAYPVLYTLKFAEHVEN